MRLLARLRLRRPAAAGPRCVAHPGRPGVVLVTVEDGVQAWHAVLSGEGAEWVCGPCWTTRRGAS
jgi:hypothetical protein